jgi:phosphate transport system regulatory protein PhoU
MSGLRQDLAHMGSIVLRQLRAAIDAFHSLDPQGANSVIETDDLIDNLNLRIESRCFDLMRQAELTEAEHRAARSILRVALNLERIGDAATSIATRVRIIRREEMETQTYDLGELGLMAPLAVEEGVRAFIEEDLPLAKLACERELEVDALYLERLGELTGAVQTNPAATRYYFHVLAVLRHLEQVGDFVLNIGEQAIFLITGRRLKFNQFQGLDSLLGTDAARSEFKPYFDGISGATVARVGGITPLLFKEGSVRKIDEEVEKSNEWERISRGLTPKVMSSVSANDRKALLREFVEGLLLSQIYFDMADSRLQSTATLKLLETIYQVWMTTCIPIQPKLDYTRQIASRLPDVYNLHPTLKALARTRMRNQGTVCAPLEEQLERLADIEPGLAPTFSVWLHGDFNPNNVVFDPTDSSIKFIDIHRSHLGDYLLDVSIFLVGLKRQPDLGKSVRRRLSRIENLVYEFVEGFAKAHDDNNWRRRLLLGLGRAFITSSRIILQPAHSEWLFRQGRIALQKVIDDG